MEAVTTDRVLASIDGALEAWERDPDAVRWHADGDGPDELADGEALREGVAWLGGRITVSMQQATEGMAALAGAFREMQVPRLPDGLVPALRGLSAALVIYDEIKDFGHPRPVPLCIDGREYHRRQLARRRRHGR